MNELPIPFTDLPMSDVTQQWLVEKPVTIAIYIVLALVVRWLLHRGIDRVTAPSRDGSVSAWRRRRQERADRRDDEAGSAHDPRSVALQPVQQLLAALPSALADHLDVAVEPVLREADDAQSLSHRHRGPAEADPLDVPVHRGGQAHLLGRLDAVHPLSVDRAAGADTSDRSGWTGS